MRSKSIAIVLVLAIATLAMQGMAAPIRYNFTTGPQASFSTPDVVGKFAGPVTGSFVYDDLVPLTGQGASPAFAFLFASLYNGALTSITGAVDGRSFSDSASGNVVVSNDAYLSPGAPPATDILLLLADPFQVGPGIVHTLSGFDIAGLQLVNVRMFWNETLLGAPDFLTGDTLPAALPAFAGRLVLDFVPVGFVPGSAPVSPRTFAFFDGLIATRVPAPGALSLLSAAVLAAFALGRRRARRS